MKDDRSADAALFAFVLFVALLLATLTSTWVLDDRIGDADDRIAALETAAGVAK